jgi:chromosome segregation ATPase
MLMTDTSTTSDATLDSKDSTVEPDGTNDNDNDSNDRDAEIAELKAQLARIEADRDEGTKRRDTALTRAQKAEQALKETQEKERKAREAAALKDRDIDSLKAIAAEREQTLQAERDQVKAELEAKLAEKETEAKTLKAQLDTSVKKAEVIRILSGICRTEQNAQAAELAYQQIQDSIELVDENGMLKPKAKGTHLSLKDFAEKALTDKGMDFLLAGQRKTGTGTQQGTTTETSSTAKQKITRAELLAMPDGGKEYFRQNPDVAKEFLEGKLK